jgi:hypothetical protein
VNLILGYLQDRPLVQQASKVVLQKPRSQKQRFRPATLEAKMNWKHRTTVLIHLVLTSVSTKGGYSKRRKGSWFLVHFVISETCSKLEAAPLRRFPLDRSRKQHQATQPLLPCINLGRKKTNMPGGRDTFARIG